MNQLYAYIYPLFFLQYLFILLKLFFNLFFLLSYSWFSILYVSGVKWFSHEYIYIFFFRFFRHIVYYKTLDAFFPMLYCRSLLVIYFIHNSVYLLITTSWFIPAPLFPLVTISLFYMSGVFLCFAYKLIHIIFLF